MCLALPGKVLEIVDPVARFARVDVVGTTRMVNLSLVRDAAPGDWVLVHTGFAVERIGEAEAAESVRLFEELAAALEADVGGMPEGAES
jgi:hydrogenase expression/formation protein HypC